jgi:ABC-2 type transport system permease protein
VNIVQIGAVFGVVASTDAPANPLLLTAAVLLAEAMFAGLALAAADFSNSPEHAQYMATPVFLLATAAAVWSQATDTGLLPLGNASSTSGVGGEGWRGSLPVVASELGQLEGVDIWHRLL